MSPPLLATKFYVPPVRQELVSRSRLIERLDAGLDRKLILVSAPAGFGKTTLVVDWLTSLRSRHTWLTLDEGDNDPSRFLAYLIAAIQRIDETVGQSAYDLMGMAQLPPIRSLITLLINDIAETPNPFVLVLDEYDAIRAASIHEAIELLIEHQPPQMHFVLVTRQDPPLALPRLRVRDQVVEIGEADLRFSQSEASTFLQQALGQDLNEEIINALEDRTEGWVAGLQLAALSVQGLSAEHIAQRVELFSGSHRHVIDYLTEDVLAQQTDTIRDFLCQTSILDRLTAPLCDVVTGQSNSKSILRQLDQANLFILPLDDQRTWYRYHRLFADFLRTELDVETQAALHAKAARWLVTQHLLPEAVKHVLAAGDMDEAQKIVSLAAAEAFRMASFVILQDWLDALPDDVVRGNSELATYQSYLYFLTGRNALAETYATAAENALPVDVNPASRGRLLSLQAHLAICANDLDATMHLSREALALLDPKDDVFRFLILNVLGQVLEVKNDVRGAVEVYRQAIHDGRKTESGVGMLVVLTNLIFSLNELGLRREAEAICRQIVEKESSETGRPSLLAGGMALAWSLLSYEANELEKALEQVTLALDLAEKANITDGILLGQYIQTRVHLASGEMIAARRFAQKGYHYASSLDASESKRLWFTALEAQINLLEGRLNAAENWATAAGFSPADTPHHWDELAYFTYVRLLLSLRRLEDARQLLSSMERSATEGERRRKLITIYLLQTLMYHKMGQPEQAITRLESALNLAAGQDYRRAILDEGQVILDLLPAARHAYPDFVDQLLTSTIDASALPVPKEQALLEPLSERELEVLRLIVAGYSNPEIAKSLYLSLNTVKWHAKNLYGKLGVGNRVEAVTRAQELHLL